MDRAKLYNYSEGKGFEGKHIEEVFEQISDKNVWIEKESNSGFGSTIKQTEQLIKELPEVFEKFEVKRLLDVPCGDFNWMKEVDLNGLKYTGGDIVTDIVEQNNMQYENEKVHFTKLNLMEEELGEHDLLFCRDCLVHFSYKDIFSTLENIKRTKITYLMTTTFPEEIQNVDIVTGGWRPLNFEKAPFSLPRPLYLLNEKCTEMQRMFKDKSMGVWKIANL